MWFRRRDHRYDQRRAHVPFDESTLPPRAYLTVDEAVQEGLLLTEYASRMSIKNSFLRRVLAGQGSWDLEHGRHIARDILQALASEADTDATNLDRLIERFRTDPRTPPDPHGYSHDDLPNMLHRRDVSRGVAARLREQSADDDYLDELTDHARRDAWREVAHNIEHNLDIENTTVDADYLMQRDQRIRKLITEDLAALRTNSREELASAEYGDL